MKPIIVKAKGVYDSTAVRGCAGWGCVIEQPDGTWTAAAGPIDEAINGQTRAEIVALSQAIAAGINRKHIRQDALVEVQTDCREMVAVLLQMIPESTCVGENTIAAAREVRGDMRAMQAMQDILTYARRYGLDLNFRIGPGDPQVKAAARRGMESVRARFSA